MFFEAHKKESWFREKYDPEASYHWKLECYQSAQAMAKKFIEEFVDEVDNKKV